MFYKITYAQNREDLILAGILKSVSQGFYVDVGANDPVLDSVTKLFYDRGWRGVNIEPNLALYRKLVEARPGDVCLQCGVSSQSGSLTFRSYLEFDGLSTFSQESKEKNNFSNYEDIHVPVRSLNDILGEFRPSGEIHFLKIDVEGMELEVLLGGDWSRYRPWVVCLERANNRVRQATIQKFLELNLYAEVFFDGINDYFVAAERHDLWDSFSFSGDVVLNGVPLYYIFAQ